MKIFKLILLTVLLQFIACKDDDIEKKNIDDISNNKEEKGNKEDKEKGELKEIEAKYIGSWELIESQSSLSTKPLAGINPFLCEGFTGLIIQKQNKFELKLIKPKIDPTDGTIRREKTCDGAKESLLGGLEIFDGEISINESNIFKGLVFEIEGDNIVLLDARSTIVSFTHTFKLKK